MQPRTPLLITIPASVLLHACTVQFSDVTKDSLHREMIGKVCSSNRVLHANGYTHTVERDRKTDGVLVSELRLSGPEITFMKPLPPYTTVTVLAAQACTNCLLESQVRYIVTVAPKIEKADSTPIHIRSTAVSSGVFQCR